MSISGVLRRSRYLLRARVRPTMLERHSIASESGGNRMNMGTPEHPEGVPHWSNKAMFSRDLERRRKQQHGFWLFFKECCGRCEGSGFIENILTDVTAVRTESEYGGFRPDILLERADSPPIWLEITHTSPPSRAKLAFCAAHGIDVFELDGSRRPIDASVRMAHISPRNCRQPRRQRLFDLWQQMARLDDPIVGIREDFRSPVRKRREEEAFWSDFEARRQDVAAGRLRCTRCNKPFMKQDDGFAVSYIYIHRPTEGCGRVPFCQECEFAIRGGWHGVFPDDASSWGLDDECAACLSILADQEKEWTSIERLRTLSMPESYGTRLVQEPRRRHQEYIVGNRTVSRSELQSVLVMFQYILVRFLPMGRYAGRMLEELISIEKAVLYANRIFDWDWLEGIGESYVPTHDSPDMSRGDKFLFPRRWWTELPPCPLAIV